MISWIQRYFQHHFKTVFAILLLIMAVPLIWVFNPSSGIGRGDRQVLERHFFDYNLNNAEDTQRLIGDAQLSIGLQLGSFGGLESEQIQQYAFQRGASLHLAEQWHLPAATTAEVTEAIKNLRMFAGPDGQFDKKAYDTFRDNLKTKSGSFGGGLTEADVVRVVGDDVRVDKVHKLLAGPGYVLPAEVKKQLERADTNWTLATATVDYAAFNPNVKPTDAELTKFFTENSFRYEIPPRVVASYVEFPSSSYLANVTVTDADVRAFYDANPSRFPKPADKTAADAKKTTPDLGKPSDPAADFAAVRPQVETALKLERAQRLAVKAASDLALALFESKVTDGPALNAFLADRKLAPKPLAPFTREAGPAEFGGSPTIATEAFRLNKERFASDAVQTPNGAAVLFWKDTQPAHTPLLTEVRDKVVADYVKNEKDKRFVEIGRTAKTQIEARLKAGDSFEKAVAAAASSTGLKIDVKMIPPFTLRTRPQDLDYSVLTTLDRLERGQVSDMAITPEKGLFVFAAEKKVPDLSEGNPQFAEMRTQLANRTAAMNGSAYIGEIVEREFERTKPKAE